MRFRWTVLVEDAGDHRHRPPVGGRAVAGHGVDVMLECRPGTTVADVLPLLGGLREGRAARPGDDELLLGTRAQPPATRLGAGGLVDGAVVRLRPVGRRSETGPGPATGRGPAAHLLDLVVLAGPDAGRRVPLTARQLSLGRSRDNGITIADPRLSRRHCDLDVTATGVSLTDRRSTNGVAGPGAGSPAGTAVPFAVGDGFLLGASVVSLRPARPPAGPPVHAAPEAPDGSRQVRRSPRARHPERAPDVRLPPPPRATRGQGFPVLAVLLPALAATALAVWTGSAVYLVLAGLGPLLVAGGWWSSRRDAHRDGRLTRKEHLSACTSARYRAQAAATELAVARARAMPDPVAVLDRAAEPGTGLWERTRNDPDALRVRLGRALDGAEQGGGQEQRDREGQSFMASAPELLPRVHLVDHLGGRETVQTAEDLVSVDLAEGSLGVVEAPHGPSVGRFVVGQLAALLPPGDLRVVVVLGASARERWRWVWLLPHCRDADAAGQDADDAARTVGDVVRARLTPERDGVRPGDEQILLVVVDDPDGELAPHELTWLVDAHRAGVHVICTASTRAGLAHGCATVLEPASEDAVELTVVRLRDGASARFVADKVGAWWADRLARLLAPLRSDARGGVKALPDRVHLSDLMDLSAAAVAARWRSSVGTLGVPLARGRDGDLVLDLTRTGPHALVAGTTGSGKSELLRSWLLALAASHPPSRVTFLLVDYKGGATFDGLAALPHTVGVLTDLDTGATVRVLASLRAEVRRRERVLAAAGARDLAELEGGGDLGPGLPRLLVVVDEFRVLAEEAPDVLGEFVRLAATGRSLGMHLILATQRPGGVVSADIRANAALRIGLRVQDTTESRDVLDRPDAAWLDPQHPGRALVVGPGVDEEVQTAWTGEPESDIVASLRVVHPALDPPGGRRGTGPAVPASLRARQGAPGSTVSRVVEQVRLAADLLGEATASPPWLPPLPTVLPRPAPSPAAAGRTRPRGRTDATDAGGETDAGGATLVLGVTDLPWRQSRGLLLWTPADDGPALVLGGSRSGRSTTLRTAAEAAYQLGVPVLHLRPDEDEDHLVDVLTALAGAPRDAPAPDGATSPALRLLVVLDDADALLDPAADPEAADELARLLRGGHRAGVGVLVAGGRTLASSRLASAARVRLVHRCSDVTDALIAGVPPAMAQHMRTPGRCLAVGGGSSVPHTSRSGDGRHLDGGEEDGVDEDGGEERGSAAPGVQRGHVDPPVVEAQVFLPGSGSKDRATRPPPDWVPGRLPSGDEVVTFARARSGPGAPGLVLLGPRVEPWLPDLERGGLTAVVGPPRSGRTNALLAVAAHATGRGLHVRTRLDGPIRLDAATERPADLLVLDDVLHLHPDDLAAVERWAEDGTGPLRARLRPGATVLVAGTTEAFADSFRGLPALLRRSGNGLVLQPGRTDVRDVLGVREAPRQRSRTPGRGVLVERGRAVRVQVLPHEATTRPGSA